jgi:CubicO group peptidase (beta-lactamase class C family)
MFAAVNQLGVSMRSLASLLICAVLLAGALAPTRATALPEGPGESAAHALTTDDVHSWLDGLLPVALLQGDVAGAVVVVVKNGETIAQVAYGYSDVGSGKPMDAERTLFRVGSVSKLFTWTAVMQLVEQGKLDLDTDINKYLDFVIPPRDGQPITLRNIMTHTAGFEERLTGLIGIQGDRVAPLGEFIKTYIPARIFPPGTTPAYSNYATAIAGYIVARVSGEAFDDYLDRHLFGPLQMPDSTFRQPLPERFEAGLSKAYAVASLPNKPIEIVGPAPAGSLTTTGANMAHFMIAHLQNGRYGETQILKPETAEYMHTTALNILPRLNRMMLGFYEDNYNGHRVIAHGGDTQWFHSDLHLFIDEGVGLFVAFNSVGKDGAVQGIRSTLFHEFSDRYFPGATAEGSVDKQAATEHAHMIAGGYTVSRRFETNFMSLLYLFSETKVSENPDGTISVSAVVSPSGVPGKWREIAPFVWREEGGKDLLSGKVSDGRVTRFSFGEVSAIEVYDRTGWSKSPGWLLPLVIGALIALALNSLAWPLSALIRRHYRGSYGLSGTAATAHRLVRIACVSVAIVFLGWITVIFSLVSVLDLISKLGGWIALLRILSPFVFVGGAGLGLWGAWVVFRGERRWFTKLWAAVLAASFLVLLWSGLVFHLISFHSGF